MGSKKSEIELHKAISSVFLSLLFSPGQEFAKVLRSLKQFVQTCFCRFLSDLIHWNNRNANWNKQLVCKNLQEEVRKIRVLLQKEFEHIVQKKQDMFALLFVHIIVLARLAKQDLDLQSL